MHAIEAHNSRCGVSRARMRRDEFWDQVTVTGCRPLTDSRAAACRCCVRRCQRAVRFLAGEAGIRQFIDIGTGIPSAGNVHELAGQVAPDARVVYVDNDPIVHVHATALLTGSGTATVVLADLRDPQAILADPELRARIDFAQPVGLLLVAILHFITSTENPAGIVATLRDALPDGSYLALSHATADFHPPGTGDAAAAAYQNATAPLLLRTRSEVTAYFEGFDLLDPGLVQAPLWRPDGRAPRPKDLAKIGIYAGVGRKANTSP